MAAQHPDDDIVRLATAPNPAQAHIWQQALLNEGIQSRVVGDYLDAGLGDIPGVEAEVWVHRDDLARAEEILRRGQEIAEEPDLDEEI
jgi:Putative prokaryotic signal transducing protein